MSYCKKAFPKIRIRTKRIRGSAADKKIQERNVLKKKQTESKTTSSEDKHLKNLESEIGKILEEEERFKSLKFKKFCADNGLVSLSEMWNLKKELWPKANESMPTGKIYPQGKIVTSPDEIKTLLSKEYEELDQDP